MNFIATHTYAVEPTVWVGTAGDLSSDGRIVGGVYNTTPWFRSEFPKHCIGCDNSNTVWGLANRSTSDYTCGSGLFFDVDNFGSPLAPNYPTSLLPNTDENKAAFEGAADLLKDVFGFGRRMGVQAAVGVEVPLGVTYPWANGTEREHFEGIFTRLRRLQMPISQFWLYSSEGSMNAGVNSTSASVQQIVRDAHTAVAALANVWPNSNVTITMSGWMLGPPDQPYYFDRVLPKEVAISTLDPNVGWDPVDPGWAGVTAADRGKILIPWAEDDPGLAGPELWVERILDHAKTGAGYGCNGLLAVHWRTSELVPEFAALQAAAWGSEDTLADNSDSDSGNDSGGAFATATAKDVYSSFCKAEFGVEVAEEMAAIFLSLDSFAVGVNLSATSYPGTPTKLPRVTQSCCGKFGPCYDMPHGPSHGSCKADACNAFLPNATCPPVGFEFLSALKRIGPKVVGVANKARFTVWEKSFEYFSQLVAVESAGMQLTEALVNVSRPNVTVAAQRTILHAALPKLERLSRAWEAMTTSLQQTVMSAGTLGTLATNDANMYLRNFPFNSTVALFAAAGLELPRSALPSARYLGPERLFVRTVRTTVLREEGTLSITATLLSQTEQHSKLEEQMDEEDDDAVRAARVVTVHWRTVSATPAPWQAAAATKIGKLTTTDQSLRPMCMQIDWLCVHIQSDADCLRVQPMGVGCIGLCCRSLLMKIYLSGM